MEVYSEACPSCGQVFTGKFCASCGEKQVNHHDFTIPHFVEEAIEGITHFDNKFFRSIYLLLFKPGALTANFEAGRRVRFMKPAQLFVISNLLYFLLVAGTNIFTVSLDRYLIKQKGFFNTHNHFYNTFGPNPDVAQLSAVFEGKMAGQSKAFIVLFIPFFALAWAALFFRKKKPLGLHLVFATHFFSFLLLFFTLFRFLAELPNEHLFHFPEAGFNAFASTLVFSTMVIYFTFAARRFYQIRWLWAFASGFLTGLIFMYLLQGYRLFLFYNIIRGMH